MKLTKQLGIRLSFFVLVAGVISSITIKLNWSMQQAVGQVPSNQNLPALPHPVPAPVDLNKPQPYNDNPIPTLPGNNNLPIDRFITREQAIGTLQKNARLISADLKPWGEHEKETFRNARLHDVSTERMVWVVKAAFPDGIETRGGFFKNATQTVTYDAQTGRFISSTTTGDSSPIERPSLQPSDPAEKEKF
ncbi:hypothetical protein [Coleofasciculus sp. H7-2]|uniref:hypothetical protein n=1 Tax=Coleofasciculus sp. H7-2 TaxID=3351545 RepID=UPI00366BD43C